MFLILSITSSAPSVLLFHGVALELILWGRNCWSPLFANESAERKSEMKEPFLCVGLLQILGMSVCAETLQLLLNIGVMKDEYNWNLMTINTKMLLILLLGPHLKQGLAMAHVPLHCISSILRRKNTFAKL